MRSASIVALILALAAAGCQRGPAGPAAEEGTTPQSTQGQSAAQATLKDIIERTPQYLVGVTFPPVANQHPVLAAALKAYAQTARDELAEAVKEAGQEHGNMPYDLSLNFTDVSTRPDAVVIAADGSLYTGGAHGTPLIARFTYLPAEQRLLQSMDLVPTQQGWQAISDYVRKQLADGVAQRMDEDEIPASERTEMLKNANAMIEEGTLPEAANFAQFEPIPAADGTWFGLRFVFPPYQVGPYSDGTQTVDVPAAVLKPYLSERYRARFTGG